MTDAREKIFDVLDESRSTCPDDWDMKHWQSDAILSALIEGEGE